MPTYEYYCQKCGFAFEIKQSFKDEPLVKCPACKKDELSKTIFVPHVFVYNEPTTVQHLADRNTKGMGKYEYQSRVKKESEGKELFAKELSGGRSPLPEMSAEKYRKLTTATPEQTRKYIDTGEI